MKEIIFPEPDRSQILKKLRKINVHGKPLRTSRNFPCKMCGRSILPLGRLAWPGAPLCRAEACEMISLSRVTEAFPTPYGRAINQQTLRIFCRTLEKERILVQRQPLMAIAEALVDGYLDLLIWQRVYHDYDRLTHPEAYARGSISLVPPRFLNEVLVFRGTGKPTQIDPTTQILPPEIGRKLHSVREEGTSALAVPF